MANNSLVILGIQPILPRIWMGVIVSPLAKNTHQRFSLTVPKQMASCYIWSVSFFSLSNAFLLLNFVIFDLQLHLKLHLRAKHDNSFYFVAAHSSPFFSSRIQRKWSSRLEKIPWHLLEVFFFSWTDFFPQHHPLFLGFFFAKNAKKMSRQQSKLKLLEVYICIHPRIGNVPSPSPQNKTLFILVRNINIKHHSQFVFSGLEYSSKFLFFTGRRCRSLCIFLDALVPA